ncbi:MAG: hypothetical protein V4662_26930 [Verrucomicrobiota bacterium]
MPYKDPEMRRQCQAMSYRNRYQASRKFRREEAERKSAWLLTEEGRESNLAASLRHKDKVRRDELKLARAEKAAARAKVKAKAAAAEARALARESARSVKTKVKVKMPTKVLTKPLVKAVKSVKSPARKQVRGAVKLARR